MSRKAMQQLVRIVCLATVEIEVRYGSPISQKKLVSAMPAPDPPLPLHHARQ
jgi:hypothetical protein